MNVLFLPTSSASPGRPRSGPRGLALIVWEGDAILDVGRTRSCPDGRGHFAVTRCANNSLRVNLPAICPSVPAARQAAFPAIT